ncbi:MAG TPA: hypothetical protein VEW93_11065 [Acidimicrobiales bacterium]|nr:hypothetical protein [Acidimicrobiales bacterium]
MFPNEVASALSIRAIDYAQLRAFYRLVRDPDGTQGVPSGWSRYTITDMAALVVALDLCGGRGALAPGKHLVRSRLGRTCAALFRQGVDTPLLTTRLRRVGQSFLVDVDGVLLDPISGQLRLAVAVSHADDYFDGALLKDPAVASALRVEVERHRSSTL